MVSHYGYSLLCSADIAKPGQLEVCAEIMATPAAQKEIEGIVCRVSLERSVSAVHWRIAYEITGLIVK